MSRIGKKPVKIPSGVKVAVNRNTVAVEGKLGKLEWNFRREVKMAVDESAGAVVISRDHDTRTARAMHGLSRAMVANMVKGVTDGYEKKLEIVGVGYMFTVNKDKKQLEVRAGYANEVHLPIPEGLTVVAPDQTHLSIKGIDKQAVGQFAAEVRSIRKPEPYKGKGIRYDGEVVRRKAGKAMTK
jgi:large subunit ribosomal protein L6